MIYLVLRKRDGRFPCLIGKDGLEFLEAEDKPQEVSWKDFVFIILKNKYGFAKKTIESINRVEPLFSSNGDVFIYVELNLYRLYSFLPFFCLSYPVKQTKYALSKVVREYLPDIKMNLEMISCW